MVKYLQSSTRGPGKNSAGAVSEERKVETEPLFLLGRGFSPIKGIPRK